MHTHRGRQPSPPIDPRRANRLRELRGRAGLKQEELADQVGISQQQLSKIENGRAPMTLEQARRIAAILGISATDLLPEQGGFTVPVTVRAGLAGAAAELLAPHRRITALRGIADVEECFAAEIADAHADRLYPPGSDVVVRPLGHRMPHLGSKVLVRRRDGEGSEILAGLLGEAHGDLVLVLRGTSPGLPAALPIQHARGPRGLAEIGHRYISDSAAVEYAPRPGDPAEILGTIVMAIIPE